MEKYSDKVDNYAKSVDTFVNGFNDFGVPAEDLIKASLVPTLVQIAKQIANVADELSEIKEKMEK